MLLEIFSDTVCPWCYIGKRRLERALRLRPQPGLTRRWRAFQLNPGLPASGMDRRQYVIAKFGSLERAQRLYEAVSRVGAQEGIKFDFDRIVRTPNTVRSHRLLYAAAEEEVLADLAQPYPQGGLHPGTRTTAISRSCPSSATRRVYPARRSPTHWSMAAGWDWAMTEDLQSRRIGINGVPFFVFNGRFGLSGAQEPEALLNMLDLAREEDTQKGVA